MNGTNQNFSSEIKLAAEKLARSMSGVKHNSLADGYTSPRAPGGSASAPETPGQQFMREWNEQRAKK